MLRALRHSPGPMTAHSDRTLACLRAAGWNPQRSVQTAQYERPIAAEGYTLHPVAREFLAQFGGLAFAFESVFQGRPVWRRFHFGADATAANWGGALLEWDWPARIGAALCPIGEAEGGTSLLAMDPDGNVYAGMDEWIALVGTSGADAIEALCTERGPLRM